MPWKTLTKWLLLVFLAMFVTLYPYRYIRRGTIELNGMPDYRIQKFDEWMKRYKDMYLLDNSVQLDYAIEDFSDKQVVGPTDRVHGEKCFEHM